jgi:Histidine kinase-, DNA gyrase B-, and HSP90-like ATPase
MLRSIGRPLKTSNPAGVLLFLAGYAIAVNLGERVYGSLAVPSPFWLPDSVLLCALLLTPPEKWWLFVAAIVPVRLLVGAVPGTPLLVPVGDNIVKHSGAAAATVELSRDGDRLALCVSDGGFGFDTRTVHERGGLGLVSMRERLRPIGGRLSIESMPLAGTRISVDVPIGSEVAPPTVLELGAGA